MRIFTISDFIVKAGAEIKNVNLSDRKNNLKISFQAVTIGKLGGKYITLSVHPDVEKHTQHKNIILSASLGNTVSGNVKLFPESLKDTGSCIVVFRLNMHLGDNFNYTGSPTDYKCGCGFRDKNLKIVNYCSECKRDGRLNFSFKEFPGNILIKGSLLSNKRIGDQMIAVIPKDVTFCIHFNKCERNSLSYLYIFNGKQIICLTKKSSVKIFRAS